MKVAALIIGIDGWNTFTRPLMQEIEKFEPDCQIVVIDNASHHPYPERKGVHRIERACYAKAINTAASFAPDADWYIILSNDVKCTGKFIDTLADTIPMGILGDIHEVAHIHFVMGWCVVAPKELFYEVGGWDENYIVSSWEDVDFSEAVRRNGYGVASWSDMPFTHLDQRQRFGLPEFQGTHERNKDYFMRKWGYA